MRILLFLLLAVPCAVAQQLEPVSVLERSALRFDTVSPPHAAKLRLTLAYLDASGWMPEAIAAAANQSARILGQCGVALDTAELLRFTAPARMRDYFTPASRELAAALQLPRPTVFFVAGTRQRPAFDAEAIGRGNSRARPELTDTVWITRGTRDLGIAMAHELVHVLMNSGEHSAEPGNLMRDETAPSNSNLTPVQCARLREAGTANGLLGPR